MNDETKAELLRSMEAEGVGETDVLAAAMRAVLTDTGGPLAKPGSSDETDLQGDEEPAPNLHHEAGDVIDLLDEAGWYFTRVPVEPEPHPASAEQRLAAFQALPNEPLETIDAHARWLATGQIPGAKNDDD